MALVKSVVLETGIELPAAYYRVTKTEISSEFNQVYFFVWVYKDEQARTDGKSLIQEIAYAIYSGQFERYFGTAVLNEEGNNPMKSCYEYLKTLPEFAEAIDV
jgi:hypothetical protein